MEIPTSELSELTSPKRKSGHPPKKKPRLSGSESRREQKRRLEAEEEERERRRLEEEELQQAEEAARMQEEREAAETKERLATTFKQIDRSGFQSFFGFLQEAFQSSDQKISSRMGKLVADRGDELFSLLAERNPTLATDWAHKWMTNVYEQESRSLWKAFRPSSTSKLSLIEAFSLEEMMEVINRTAPYLVDLLVAIGTPQVGAGMETHEKRRRDSRLVCSELGCLRVVGRAANTPLSRLYVRYSSCLVNHIRNGTTSSKPSWASTSLPVALLDANSMS